MADPVYLVRLDDANPWMDREKWGRIEALLDRYGVKPIVAVVPECLDPEIRVADEDLQFWTKVRAWKAKGWTLALHGRDHVFTGRGRGLVPLNSHTEFAGRPEAEQREKIRNGWAKMVAEDATPTVWVAPAHTFDKTTVKVLREETSIRMISDGLASKPFSRFGMAWFPQQLWRPRGCPSGVWTLCLHPNDHTPDFVKQLQEFLGTRKNQVVSLEDLPVPTRPWGWGDGLFSVTFRLMRTLKRMVRA